MVSNPIHPAHTRWYARYQRARMIRRRRRLYDNIWKPKHNPLANLAEDYEELEPGRYSKWTDSCDHDLHRFARLSESFGYNRQRIYKAMDDLEACKWEEDDPSPLGYEEWAFALQAHIDNGGEKCTSVA